MSCLPRSSPKKGGIVHRRCGWRGARSEQAAPTAKNAAGQRGQPRGVAPGVEGRGELADIAAVDVLGAPVRDHRGSDLEVKLESVHAGAYAKSLVAAAAGVREKGCAGRQIEGFAVPVEDGFGRFEAGKKTK